ncbi:hypothetical protein [Pyxidicoccus xibeiensis]|uniref:hypothetical protein n=1 Tax=Pyxidicoccus xibeiensis TaxID=2906759 RepID=UPI0020A7263D|nr:hypothetical protein [Pyxidicoccus xibeiensis]MCP3139115.1 hypothetical protein [Pyxidicoccus xibeiensis]
MAPVRPTSGSTARPAPTTIRAEGRAQQPASRSDSFEQTHKPVSQATSGFGPLSDGGASTQVRRAPGPQQLGSLDVPGRANSGTVEGVNTRGARWASAEGTAASVSQLPGAGYLTFRDTRDFFRNPSGVIANKASGAVASPTSTGPGVAKGILEPAGNVSAYRAAANAARTALAQVAPDVANAARTAITQAAPDAARAVASRVATSAAREALEGGSREMARAAGEGLEAAGRLGANAARAAVHGDGTAVARAASRFAPGLNMAIAVADTSAAASTIADPSAAAGRKVTAGITALGSIAAGTHVPVVSQVGAAASTVSGFIGSFV